MAEKGFSEYFVNDGSDFSVDHGAILIVDMPVSYTHLEKRYQHVRSDLYRR